MNSSMVSGLISKNYYIFRMYELEYPSCKKFKGMMINEAITFKINDI